jgi:hypothetical protein
VTKPPNTFLELVSSVKQYMTACHTGAFSKERDSITSIGLKGIPDPNKGQERDFVGFVLLQSIFRLS